MNSFFDKKNTRKNNIIKFLIVHEIIKNCYTLYRKDKDMKRPILHLDNNDCDADIIIRAYLAGIKSTGQRIEVDCEVE